MIQKSPVWIHKITALNALLAIAEMGGDIHTLKMIATLLGIKSEFETELVKIGQLIELTK